MPGPETPSEAMDSPTEPPYHDDQPSTPDGVRSRLASVRAAIALVFGSAARDFTLSLVSDVVASVALAGQLACGGLLVARLTTEGTTWSALWPLVAGLVGLTLVQAVATTVSLERRPIITEQLARRLSGEIIEVAVAAEYEAYHQPGFHNRLERAGRNIEDKSWTVVWSVGRMSALALDIVAIAVVLAAVAPVLLAVGAGAFVPLALASRANAKKTYQLSYELTEDDRRRNYLRRLLTESTAAKEVRSFGLERRLAPRHDQLYADRVERVRRVVRQRTRYAALASMTAAAIAGAAIAVVVWLTVDGRISVASAAVGVVAFRQLSARLRSLDSASAALFEGSLFLDDYRSFVGLLSDIHDQRPAGRLGPVADGGIELDGVSFRYPGARHDALSDVTLTLRPGQSVAVVGPNGSGKTTLALLLAGIFRPTSGQIRWAGIDLADVDPREHRRNVAPVFQDYVCYELSARDNIGLGAPGSSEADIDAVHEAARRVGIHDTLAGLGLGYTTTLSKAFADGTDLSMGQWQRVATARACLRDAPLVVLDEPSAALDPAAERQLFDQMRDMAAERTLVFTTHRFSTVRDADRVVVLEDGRVTGIGTHDDLDDHPTYRRLYGAQAAAFAPRPLEQELPA